MVPVRPEYRLGRGAITLGRCYDGVAEYLERSGGTFQHGWMIWETQGLYLRAFHHCVHRDGRVMADVSPQDYRKILFLPTSEPGLIDEAYRMAIRRGDPYGVRSRYFPLCDSALARRVVALHETKDEAERYSAEWFHLLDEIADLEIQFHEEYEAKNTARRPRLTNPRKRSRR